VKDETPASLPPVSALGEKEQRLRALLRGMQSAVVAFSGGTDSAYLAVVAAEELGRKALSVTADSPSYPARHRATALEIAARFGVLHEFVQTAEIDRPEYRSNPVDRCYYCKQELFTRLREIARDRGLAAVLDGNNADDRGDYRPGRKAATELGVRSPLDEAGLTKDEIRLLSRKAGLPTWDEPASACLSSRIPYHSEVTPEKLRMIEAAEEALRSLGFRLCRVRHHDEVARLEVSREEMGRAVDPEISAEIVKALKGIGYRFVSLDLQGYRTGSLNEVLRLRPA
jgi:pyridinium-3,5-biscarboxylic acid mononucleotide sulfurtransferase